MDKRERIMEHKLNYCKDMINLCLICHSKEHKFKQCKKMQFRNGNCCFTCGFPQTAYGEPIHGNFETGECKDEEELRDIIPCICWQVFRNIELKKKYLNENLKEDVFKK